MISSEDKSKFREIENKSKIHPIIRKEKSISYYIKKYIKNYDSEITNSLIPSVSQPGKFYGLAKVHKDECPLRPVVSMINKPENKLAKFLDNIVQPYIPYEYILKSTGDFINQLTFTQIFVRTKISKLRCTVVSLFTNVPLEETIKLTADELFSEKNSNQPLMKKKNIH